MQLIDGNTYNYGYIGSRATGTEAGDYLVVGPDWKGETPAGIKKVFHSTTPVLASPSSARSSSTPTTCRTWRRCRRATRRSRCPRFSSSPRRQPRRRSTLSRDDGGDQGEFLRVPRRRLAVRPAVSRRQGDPRPSWPASASGRARPSSSRISRGAQGRRPAGHEGRATTRWTSSSLRIKDINGWKVGSFFGDRAFYNGDWLKRAAAAKGGIYGNDAVEAMYPHTRVDATGETLDGSKHNYTLTFAKGQLPPVNAFWSVTMYDGKTQLLIKNPINRYLINSPMLPGMKKNADGSLTLYIQKESPGKD